MNLQSWKNNQEAGAGNCARSGLIFGQSGGRELYSLRCSMKSLPARIRTLTVCLCWAMAAMLVSGVSAQTNYYNTNGTQYAIVGSQFSDQVFPDVAIGTNGGFVVWQDTVTDGDNWGISARRLDATLSGTLGTFRVNVTGAGSQENSRVAMLKNGGAAFVWEGGRVGYQHIFARFLTSTNTFTTTNDITVSTYTNNFQVSPALAVLNNSNVVVVWAGYKEAGSNTMQDVYGQIMSPAGAKIGAKFLVNQFTNFNQRTPAVTALANGGFLVAWVSEQQRQQAATVGTNSALVKSASQLNPSVDIYARLFNASGTATTNEFLVNPDLNACANPAVAAATDGSFLIAWTSRDMTNANNSLDVRGRTFTSSGVGGTAFYLNAHRYGDQYVPRVSALGVDYLVTWTSLAQDGSYEGVYGQFVRNDGGFVRDEFRVNTTTLGQQMHPAVAADGANQFLVVWSGFTGYPNTFDLFAQRYINAEAVLQPMSAPYVWAPFVIVTNKYQPQLVVSWAPVMGLSVSNYEVYVNGASTPSGIVTSNQWIMTAAHGLTTNTTKYFQVAYVTSSGRRSPLSATNSGTTWKGLNWYGIPYEWMAAYFGGYYNGSYTTTYWPLPGTKMSAGGPTLTQVFTSGGNPLDASTWLQTVLTRTPQGIFLGWNTQPGATYQVQTTTNLSGWSNFGTPRFAAGTSDSIYIGGGSVGYYRVVLLR